MLYANYVASIDHHFVGRIPGSYPRLVSEIRHQVHCCGKEVIPLFTKATGLLPGGSYKENEVQRGCFIGGLVLMWAGGTQVYVVLDLVCDSV